MTVPADKGKTILYDSVYQQYAGRSFGRQMSDWQERVDMNRMRAERAQRFRQSMKDAGANVMLLLIPANERYATGHNCLAYTTGLSYCIVPLEGEPVIFGHGTPSIQDRRQVAWIKPENVRYAIPAAIGSMASGLLTHPSARKYQLEKFGNQIKDTLDEMGLGKEVIVLDAGDGGVISILEQLGLKVAVRPEIAVSAQEIKTRDEIECVRMTASICDILHYEVARYARPGVTELELSGYVGYLAMKMGCQPGSVNGVMSGNFGWPNFRNITDRQLRPGDIFYVDCCQVAWNGYNSCTYRTHSCITEPSQQAQDAYKRIQEWMYGALSECKPGNTTADMLKHFPDEEEIWGLHSDYTWGDNLMHGIGLINYGPPHAIRSWAFEHPYELKEGQCFAIETQDGTGDGQGVRLEEMVVVTQSGCEVLTRYPIDKIDVCPLL